MRKLLFLLCRQFGRTYCPVLYYRKHQNLLPCIFLWISRKKNPSPKTRAWSLQFRRSVATSHQNARLRFPLALTAGCHVCLSSHVRHRCLWQAGHNYQGDLYLTWKDWIPPSTYLRLLFASSSPVFKKCLRLTFALGSNTAWTPMTCDVIDVMRFNHLLYLFTLSVAGFAVRHSSQWLTASAASYTVCKATRRL